MENNILVKAARAVVLTAHSAAGLATAASSREAVRLLRAAEALSRSAVAVLSASPASTARTTSQGVAAAQCPSGNAACGVQGGGAGDGTSSGGHAHANRRRRRPRSKKTPQKLNDKMKSCEEGTSAPCEPPLSTRQVGTGVGASGPPTGGNASRAPGRVLSRHETMPGLPPRPPSWPSACSSPLPHPGSRHRLVGLTARTKLIGRKVRFLRVCADSGRYVVDLLNGKSDAPLRVKPNNLVAADTDVDMLDGENVEVWAMWCALSVGEGLGHT